MRYIKYLLFLLISLMPISVLAYGVQLSCPKEVKPNETFKCTIYSPSFCSEISMELVLPNGFTLKSESAGRNFRSNGTGNNLSYTAIGEIDRVLSTITIEAPSESAANNTIELRNLKYKYTNEDSEYTITTNITENITFKGTTTTTSSQNNANNFVLSLDSNNNTNEIQTLSCTPANGNCDVSLENANIPSKEGYIFKGWGKDKNCLTGELVHYTITEDTLLYACYVSNMVGHLKSLTVDGYELVFNPNQFNYDLNVREDETKLNVKAEGYSQSAKIDINNPELTGNDTITINVTEGDITSTYYIKVTKGNQNNGLIKNISIGNYDFKFDSNITEYNLTVSSKENKLNIIVEPNDNVEINIIGNENLTDGSIIMVVGKTNTSNVVYKINILFEKSNINLYYYFAGGFILFMFIVYFVVRHYKIKNGELPGKGKKDKQSKEVKIKEKKPKKEKKKNSFKEEVNDKKEPPIETLDL